MAGVIYFFDDVTVYYSDTWEELDCNEIWSEKVPGLLHLGPIWRSLAIIWHHCLCKRPKCWWENTSKRYSNKSIMKCFNEVFDNIEFHFQKKILFSYLSHILHFLFITNPFKRGDFIKCYFINYKYIPLVSYIKCFFSKREIMARKNPILSEIRDVRTPYLVKSGMSEPHT